MAFVLLIPCTEGTDELVVSPAGHVIVLCQTNVRIRVRVRVQGHTRTFVKLHAGAMGLLNGSTHKRPAHVVVA
jgi:hypothetical protein